MKKMILGAAMLVMIVFANAQTKNFIDQPYIEVTGNADTLVTPNEIYIRIQLSEKDTKDKISIEELEQKMISALNELGINTENELTTSDMVSNFRFYFLKNREIIKGKVYTLKVVDAITTSKVFMKFEEIGISNVSIARVDHSDFDNLKNNMRSMAILHAKAKATSLTKPLNQSVGPAIQVIDAENNQQPQGRAELLEARNTLQVSGYGKELPRIEFEKIKIEAAVSVKFILR